MLCVSRDQADDESLTDVDVEAISDEDCLQDLVIAHRHTHRHTHRSKAGLPGGYLLIIICIGFLCYYILYL